MDAQTGQWLYTGFTKSVLAVIEITFSLIPTLSDNSEADDFLKHCGKRRNFPY